jgi:hypothetical protein
MAMIRGASDRRGNSLTPFVSTVAGAALVVAGVAAMTLVGGDGAGSCTAAGPTAPPEGRGLWISDSHLDEGRRLLLVVDPERRHAAVYHVDAATGTLALKSTRDIGWDLMLGDFNAQPPKPADIRKMIEAGGAPAVPSR